MLAVRLASLVASDGIYPPYEQYRFHPTRRWAFDFAWPASKVAIEVEGGVFVGGRHTRGMGFVKDCEKYNTATEMGWRVFRVPVCGQWLDETMALIERVLSPVVRVTIP